MSSPLDFLRNLFRRSEDNDSPVEERVYEIAEEHGISTDAVLTMASIAADEYNEKMARWRSLTLREQDVAVLIFRGYTNREIAERLNISITTVKTHIRKILMKFDLNSKNQFRQYFDGWNIS